MPLNLTPRTSEDFIPYLKFNGKAGRWYSKNDDGVEYEIQNMTALFDLAQIKTGWILFTEGAAPDIVWDNGATAVQPTPKHKRGFSLNAFSPKELGGIREFSATSNSAIIAIRELYDRYENAPEAKKGLVPLVKCESVMPVKSKFGTNYQPIFIIVKWVPRPEALPAGSAVQPATEVPPPIQLPSQAAQNASARNQQPADDDEEF
jgi:hypothetical protein